LTGCRERAEAARVPRRGELEQLCCLGLPAGALVPELLARLHDEVASHWNHLFWFDREADIVDAYAESPAFYDALPLYYAEFYQRGEYELIGASHKVFMRQPAVVEDMRGVVRDDRKVERSGMYNELLRPLGIYNPVYVKVREGGRPVAMVQLNMDASQRDVDAAARRRLERLAPFIAHGLAAPKSFPLHGFEDDDSGVLVFDRSGVLQHVSPSARKLLFLATHAEAGPREIRRSAPRRMHVPEAVQRLCADVQGALEGRAEGRAAPTHFIDNRWGRFAFRAYPLDPVRRDDGRIGVVVQRQVPTAVALWREIRKLGLPAKRAEVCFHLANGRAYSDIAKAMSVSINTVTWHVREIYARFDVHSAAELSRKLLSLT